MSTGDRDEATRGEAIVRRGMVGAMSALVIAAMLMLMSGGSAQEPAAPAATTPAPVSPAPEAGGAGTKNWLSWTIEACGIFFYPQLAIAVAIVAIIATNFYGAGRGRFVRDKFVEEFDELVKNKQFKEAFEQSKGENNFLGRVVFAGLSRLTDGYADAVGAMQEAGTAENMKHEHRLSYLSMLANIATLVGLLGTVAGMVASFTVLSESDVAPSPSKLAQGVSMALVTTVIGLIEAIPAIMCYTILGNLNSKRVQEVATLADHMLRPFKQVAVARKPSAGTGTGTSNVPPSSA